MSNFALPYGSVMVLNTYTPSYEFTFKWTIESLTKLPNYWKEKSVGFSIEPLSEWHVEFQKKDGTFYLYICRKQDTNYNMSYNLTITDSNDEILYSESGSASGTIREDTLKGIHSSLNRLKSASGQLLINIVIKVEKNEPTTSNVDSFSITPEMRLGQMEKLSRKLKNMFDQSLITDLTLTVEGESVTCHKAILAGMSPVFARMLQKGMLEEESSIVDIDDISLSTVKALLSYMYSAEVVDYDFDKALEVYAAADKYEVLDLKDVCGLILASKVTIETAYKVLYFADLHQDPVLKDKMMQFINLHYKPVKKQLSVKS